MKKLLTFLMMSVLAIGVGWAAESVYYTLTPTAGSNSNYASSCDIAIDGITWNVTGNAQMIPWRIGGKSISNTNRTVFSKTAISSAISKVALNVGNANSITVNSLKLTVASDANFSSVLDEVSATFKANSTIYFVPSTGTEWAKNAYYKFTFNVTVNGSTNRFVEFSGASFYSYREKVATPTFSVTAGHYTTSQNVTIDCATEGADIYWGYDGENFTSYDGSSILVNETITLYAYAMKSGMDNSNVASAKYYIETPAQPGDELIFDYRNSGDFAQEENASAILQSSKNGITIDFAKEDGTNAPLWYSTGDGSARVYANNTITINAESLVIESVTFTYDDGTNVMDSPSVTPGSWSAPKWTINATNGTLTVDKKAYISTITVKLADAGVIVVAAPTISGNESFVGSTEVTITAEDGATIYYTKDGTDPTVESTLYSAPFTIYETTTVKAIAESEGTLSSIASKTFTAIPSVSTVAAFNALEDNTVIGFTGDLVAVAQNGQYLYAQDNENGILIYGNVGQTYTLGNVIPGGFTGTKTTYKGAPEMTNPSGLVASTSTVQVTPIELTPSQVTLENFGRYAVIKNATISNGKIVVADQNVTCYTNTLGVNIPENYEGKTYDITGVCGYYNSPQFLPLEFNEVSSTAYPDYYLVGTFNMNGNEWVHQDENYKFTRTANGDYYLNNVELADDVQFKIIKVENGNETWIGGDNSGLYEIHGGHHANMPLYADQVNNFHMAVGGICTFTIGTDEKLSVEKTPQLFMKGSYSNDDWATKTPLTSTDAGWTITMELAAGTQFGFVDEWNNWKGGNGYWIYLNEHEINGETVPSDMGKELDISNDGHFVMVDAGNYVLTVNSDLTKLVATVVPVPHNVIVAGNIENGTVTVDKESAIAGDVVAITATPADGYIPDVVTVMAGETLVAMNGHTFVMPNADVTVSATFKQFAHATNFKQVTALSQLEAGKQILLVGVKENDGVYVMSTIGTNNRQATQLNETGELPTFITYAEGYNTLVLGASDIYYNFYEVGNKGYIQPANNGKNQIKVGNLCDNAFVNITIEDGIFDVVFSKSEESRNNMRFNATNNPPLFSCYASGQNPVYIYIETDEDPQPEPVVLDGVAFTADRQWATWYGDASLALPENVTAYVVTGVQGDAVSVEALDYIPAGTGVLLYSETAAESVSAMPYTGEAGTIPTNLLVGSLEAQTVSNAYLLYNNQFILAQDGTTVGAHRCYLPMSASAQGIPVLKIGTPGTVTGIETINANGNGDNTYYNLMGQPVANPTPGIYIRGGKKVIVK